MSIIFFAAIAAYIFFKLNQQLGKIDEEEKRQIEEKILQSKATIDAIQQEILKRTEEQKIVGASSTSQAEEKILLALEDGTKQNLINILQRSNITAEFFVNGAKSAFEMVIKAFCAGDLKTLKFLLSEKIYHGFEAAITQRTSEEKSLTTNLIAIEKTEIISAVMLENIASIVVKFVSKQINYISDKNSNLVEGKKDEICEITDVWMFKRDVTSSNPNWIVSATNLN